jgi:hypothetical protein
VSAWVPDHVSLSRASDAGVRALGLALHGARREVHDWHAREAGSFARVLDAIAAARGVGMRVGVASLVTRSNARVLGELPSLLVACGVELWALVQPRAWGPAFTAYVPRLGLAAPAVLAAAETARRRGLEARLVGFPTCVVGPYAGLVEPGARRGLASPCERCAEEPECVGLDPRYLERFGDRELAPRVEQAPRSPRVGASALGSLFVDADVWWPLPFARSLGGTDAKGSGLDDPTG